MNDLITCPHCQQTFALSDAMQARLTAELNAKFQAQLTAALQKQSLELEKKFRQEQELLQKLKQDSEAREIALLKEKARLEQQAGDLELRIAQEKEKARQEVRREEAERRAQYEALFREKWAQEHEFALRERDQKIADLSKSIEELKRKSEQGSQERQGELLEGFLKDGLKQRFSDDLIEDVEKGRKGGDLIQTVHNAQRQVCGKILWESKNTKTWQNDWLNKARSNRLAANCQIAVIVSATLPKECSNISLLEDVWVCGIAYWPGLAQALRQGLLEVAFVKQAQLQQGDKMQYLYNYMASQGFRQRLEMILNAFERLQKQIQEEKRAMEKQWKEREKLLDIVIEQTAQFSGEVAGIMGQDAGNIASLALHPSLLADK
jgi:hypothetical protein